jgi:DNA-binding transcriptional LysR family regulator
MQVNEPEGHVGLPLFERNGRQVALTTAGEYMLVDARKVIATLKDAEDAAARLQRLEVDIAVMGRPSKELATRAEPFAEHPLLKVGHPTVDSLRPCGFILRERGSGTRAAMEKFLETLRMEPRVVMEITSNETIKQAMMAGMGISFPSLHTIGLELEHA